MPESVRSDVTAMEEVGICVYGTEHQHKTSERRQHVHVPSRLRYPFRLLSSASKNNGENEQHGCRKRKSGVGPTDPVTRLQPKQHH